MLAARFRAVLENARSRLTAKVLAVCCAALMVAAGGEDITAAFGKTRTISFYNIHNQETLTILYKKDGKFIPSAMEKINWILRDWRKNEATHMDPALVDLLWEIHTELGSREPIHIISGYRARDTNEMLRKTVGGQASQSRHILGKAADVQFPDIPLKNLRYSALIRERGGVGYYPTSAIPFVHVDTDRVRHWPRMPRYELALLFPDGHTHHVPTDGMPITPADAKVARAEHKELAIQIAALRKFLATPREPVMVAEAGTPTVRARREQVAALAPPRLIEPPQPVDRPSRLQPTTADRTKLDDIFAMAAMPKLVSGPVPATRPHPQGSGAQVAAIDPSSTGRMTDSGRFGWASGWVRAPAFDDEHPEELSYSPFPIAQLLTASPSADDPVLARLTHPDTTRALELLDQSGSLPPMRLRPSPQLAEAMWSREARGEALDIDGLLKRDEPAPPPGLATRRVPTSER